MRINLRYFILFLAVYLVDCSDVFACSGKKEADNKSDTSCSENSNEKKCDQAEKSTSNEDKKNSRGQLKYDYTEPEDSDAGSMFINENDTYKSTSRHGRSHMTRELTNKNL